ncbi:hypothetical protein HPB47_008676 [Ixodes persulcatus]|uniref:Uncharacterized protein n=1 Tax=Ixodes persulcatus TaxID=34615 RepID=A0AC60P448_IXOPE|nr:hypothetical protein HPB47_008676 [Ixodes persulcatus]
MGRKQASLSLRLSLETDPPAVILLQEPGKKAVKIKDYRTVGGNQYFMTLVHRSFVATERDLDGSGVECGYVVIAPVKKRDRGIHIVNLYGNPKLHKVDYTTLLGNARTATDKLLKLGVHNTIDELHEAHLVAQLKRSTKIEGWLMDILGMAVPGGTHTGTVPDHKLSAEIRKKIVVSRIPRNMQPGKDDSRREARSETLLRKRRLRWRSFATPERLSSLTPRKHVEIALAGWLDADLSFNEALKTKKLDRRVFPGPCGGLGKGEERTWRRLQTGNLVTPAKLHHLPFCGDPRVDVHHVTWKCKKIPGLAPLVEPSTQEWEAGLQSDVIDVQKLLVTRALHAQATIGALV